MAAIFISEIKGDYYNVVGLPISRVYLMKLNNLDLPQEKRRSQEIKRLGSDLDFCLSMRTDESGHQTTRNTSKQGVSGCSLLSAVMIVGTVLLTGCVYNTMQTQDEAIKAKWSEVINQYQREQANRVIDELLTAY